MKISYNELGIDEKNIDLISKKFFQLGHEVEEIIDMNIDGIKIGRVVSCDNHHEADKLKVCKVDIKDEILQIVCGAPNVYEGMKVVVATVGSVINKQEIKKVNLRGVESSGMLCSLEELGFSKELLNLEDYSGILELDEEADIGNDAMRYLKLNDKILDIFLTANRGDCQSYRGLYNDMISLCNYDYDTQINKYNTDFVSIGIKNSEIRVCDEVPYFSYQEIKNIDNLKTPLDIKIFLLKNNMKSQNLITDISNIAMLKYGTPTHIYDLDKIKGKVSFDYITSEEKFIGLDGQERNLPENTCVIRDNEKIIAIAGVMGSESTKITENTKNILIEAAVFPANEIFKSSKIIKKKTEASLRYEKKIDMEMMKKINEYIISELDKYNNKLEISEKNYNEVNQENTKVVLKYTSVEKILGIKIEKDKCVKILEHLDFLVNIQGNLINVTVPSARHDINGENDLIEELMRIYNVDNISIGKNISSFNVINKIIEDNTYFKNKELEEHLLLENLNQVITYSLISESEKNKFITNKEKSVKVMSSLSKNHEYYRQSIVPSLIKVAEKNLKNQKKQINLFEIANTYTENEEINKLAILLAGENELGYGRGHNKYDFYDLKRILDNLFDKYGLDYKLKECVDIYELNPYSSAYIYIDDIKVGFIGEVVFDYYKKMSEKIFVLEINMNMINKKEIKYKQISSTPRVTRDLTITVERQTQYKEIDKLFKNIKWLKKITFNDLYKGEHIDEDKKALTFNLQFQDNEKTLTNEEVDVIINEIIESAQKLGFEINS